VLNLFAEIYDTVSSRTPQRIEVITTLVGEDGVAAFSSREHTRCHGRSRRRDKRAHPGDAADSAQGAARGALCASARGACARRHHEAGGTRDNGGDSTVNWQIGRLVDW
jgi:hypothetical protein